MQDRQLDPKSLLRTEKSLKETACCTGLCSLFCCCTHSNVPFTQPNQSVYPWKLKWKKIVSKLNTKKLVDDKVFHFLLQLAADQFTREDYDGLQIEPNLHRVSRDDLEFYVPQLVNFLLFGEYEQQKTEEMILFLLNACMIDFYFAHRVHWFLWCNDFGHLEEPKVDVEKNSNVLCLGNASELAGILEALRRSQVSSLIPLSDRISLYNTMRGPTDDDPRCTLYPVRTPLINPREVLIPPYKTGETADHYMSTMYFVQDLTDISIKLLRADNKKERLVEALHDINSKLPAAAYLPFDKSFTRECAVLHIPISEVKVFKTKERAPFLICIEIYKPFDELQARYHEEASESMCSLSGSEEEAAPAVPTSRRASVLVSSNLTYGNYQQIMSEATQQVRLSHGIFPRVRAESLIEAESPLMEIEEEDKDDDAKMLDEHYSNHVIAGAIGTHTKAAHSSVNVRQTIAYVYGEQSDQPQQQSSPSDFHHTRNVFGESAKEQKERLKRRSPFGHFRTWNVISIIVKSGDDLKQEQLAMQLISQFHQIFRQSKLNLWLRPYEILATGPDCGILECVTDAMSIDSLKKSMPGSLTSLSDFFIWQFGGEKAPAYKAARKSFVESFAAYSLVCYILQIKDRHNGNILLDNQGHVIHIDFGFLISNSPGKGIKFEQAPFKLTNEFVNVMGGVRSSLFLHFRKLCVKGFIALRRNQQKIWILLEMMRTGSGASLSCFMGGEQAMLDLRERFNPREEMSSSDCREYINRLIDESLDHWTTRWYDRYQRWCQNIL